MAKLLEILRKECETAINWFKTNSMTDSKPRQIPINDYKFLERSSNFVSNIDGVELTMESSVKLLGIEIDNKLNFE